MDPQDIKVGYSVNKKKSSVTKTHPITIDILDHATGSVIKTGVDIKILRRFSKACKPVLPAQNTTTEAANAVLKLKIKPAGAISPPKDAIVRVLEFLEKHKRVEIIQGEHIKEEVENEDLSTKISIYAALLSLKPTFGINDLRDHVNQVVYDRPVTKDELSWIWEMLPANSKVLNTAVRSFTFFWRRYMIEEDQEREVDDYLLGDVALLGLFDHERQRQDSVAGRRAAANRRKKGARQGEGKRTGGGAGRQ